MQIIKGGPTKNPKINKRGGLLFGTGEYLIQIEDISFLSYDDNLVMSKRYNQANK